ncbi:MAG: NUDIX domain-containing protein [Candidatus Nanoarchaeia archaeon]|jgi:8-oxo-dGTP pyrophosphatase MutT (NUDIX family)
MSSTRRKGAAIVDTPKGIVVVAGHSKKFMLPGGGAELWESRKKAAIRELYEETGLKTKSITYLFRYTGKKWHSGTKPIRNHTKVFLIESDGEPRPRHEIKHVAFWKPGSKIYLTTGTRMLIDKYLQEFKG